MTTTSGAFALHHVCNLSMTQSWRLAAATAAADATVDAMIMQDY